LNAAIRAAALARNIPYADLFTPVGNPATYGWSNAAYTVDGTHPTPAGAALMGAAVASAVLPSLSAAKPSLVTSGDETTGWTFWNGRFTSDANANGQPLGGSSAGTADDFWGAATNTAALTLVSGAGDGVDGNWLTMTKTGSATTASTSTTTGTAPTAPTSIPGQVYEYAFKAKHDSTDADFQWNLKVAN